MEKVRQDRLHDLAMKSLRARLIELGKTIQDIVSEIGQPDITPYECEISIPEIFDLINLDPAKEFDLQNSRPALRILIQGYLQKRVQDALQQLAIALRHEYSLDGVVNPFSLAVGSYFRCVFCKYVFKCEEAVLHICRHRASSPRTKPDWMSDEYFHAVLECFPLELRKEGPQIMWSVDNFQPAFARVAPVIEACGFNVKTATVKDLDAVKNLRLICINHKNLNYLPIMTWRTAVRSNPQTLAPWLILSLGIPSNFMLPRS